MRTVITLNDLIAVPVCLAVILLIMGSIKRRNIDSKPYFKYFISGYMVKCLAGIAFALIYTYHYGETDTHYYFWGTQSIERLMHKDFEAFIKVMAGVHTPEVHSAFDWTTGWPTYWRDVNSFAVCRFNVPLYILGFKTFLGDIVILNAFLFFGYWKFYELMLKIFPHNERNFAIALFYVPSVVFWGSGLLKDGWCITTSFLIFYAVYNIFVARRRLAASILLLVVSGYMTLSIRPYTFFTTMAANLIWIGFLSVYKMHSRLFRTLLFPIIALIVWGVGVGLFSRLSTFSNERYQSLDSIIETAVIIQDDLKKEYYGGNSFDIGEIDPSIGGLLSKAPKAIVAGMFRPFLWDSRNALMLLSAIETFTLLVILAYILMQLGVRNTISVILRHPFLVAASVFMVTYAFFVGLTTANFGALVRYRMPVIVFLALILAVLWRYVQLSRHFSQSDARR